MQNEKFEKFKRKVKETVSKNFDKSFEKYFEFENKYNFFKTLAIELANFLEVKNNSKIIDIGAGYGCSMAAIKETFNCDIKGIDISEEMVCKGKALYKNIDLICGDGENLSKYFNEKFDIAMYNASIFIMPDSLSAFKSAYKILNENGKIGFSHYPKITNEHGENLLKEAFKKINFEAPPKFVISDIDTCKVNLKNAQFSSIEESEYCKEFSIEFLIDFFSIPAQSSSLFPKLPYEQRLDKIKTLFKSFENFKTQNLKICWPLVKAKKS